MERYPYTLREKRYKERKLRRIAKQGFIFSTQAEKLQKSLHTAPVTKLSQIMKLNL
jgi:hypothetical protein